MNKPLHFLFLLCFALGATVHLAAQQRAQFSMNLFHGLYLSPAYAGSHEGLSATASYRNQWVKLPGAPQTATVGLHGTLKNNRIGLGVIYSHHRIGVSATDELNASFAYRIPVGKKKKVKLCFGVSTGFANYRTNLTNVATTQPNDPSFIGTYSSRWLFHFGLGVYVYSNRFFAGVSVPNLLANRLVGKSSVYETSDNVAKQYCHLLFTGGYVFSVTKKVKLMPSVLVKYVPAHAPVTFDFNATAIFIDRIWLGAGYRFNDSYHFMLAANVYKQLKIGYSYDLPVSGLRAYTSGSHEVVIGFDMNFVKGKLIEPAEPKFF